ncbi:MAG: right-handed parallel beta-helix repeat-containing protein [Verrucomicrobiota bacterium]
MKIRNLLLSNLVVMMITGSQAGTVTTTHDSGAGSLREVMSGAIDHDVIDFASSLNGATITLSSGSLGISGVTLTLDASALSAGIILSGDHSSRIFTITGNANVTLRSLHLRDGLEREGNGGGIFALSSHLLLDGCSIQDCVSAYDGGGLWGNGVTGSIERCRISGNQAGSFGGGVFLIGVNGSKFLDISSTQISGNVAPFGGGIYNLAANPTLRNCSIQGNSGGGMRSEKSANPLLRNCIVWGNTMISNAIANCQIHQTEDCHPDISYCLIQGASDASSFSVGSIVTWGIGNLDGCLNTSDPGFVAAVNASDVPNSASDLRLFIGSPCLNAGNNDFGSPTNDLSGNARIQGISINLGAFEGGYESFSHLYPDLDPAGDNNGNGLTNFLEYALDCPPDGPVDAVTLPAVSIKNSVCFLTTVRRSNGIDIMPLLETSTRLNPTSWVPMIQDVDYSPESVTVLSTARQQVVFRLLVSDPARFYRQGFSTGK